MRCAVFGLAAADLVLIRLVYGAMIGQLDQIDRNAAPTFAQAFGYQTGQQGIERVFELIEFVQLLGQFAQHGYPRGGPVEVVAGLVDREPGGGGKDQDVEQVSDLHVVAPGFQRQMSQGVDGQGQHVLAIEGILRMHAHGDSPSVRGDWFFLIIGEFP